MGDFTDAIDRLSGTAPDESQSKDGTYGTPARLLDNLKQTESSGNPNAVNKDSGAMGAYQFMPSTVAALRQKGIKFDPFDEQQSRDAADQYIQKLKTQHGDYPKAMAAYGGFVTKDPTAYVGKVLAGVDGGAPTAPAEDSGDSFLGAIDKVTGGETSAPVAGPAGANTSPADIPDQTMPTVTVSAKKLPPQEPSFLDKAIGVGETGLNLLTGAASAVPAGIAGLSSILTNGKYGTQAGVDEAAQRFHDVSGAYTYDPKTATGKQYAGAVGDAINNSGVVGLGPMVNMHGAGMNKLTAGAADAAEANPLASKLGISPAASVERIEPTLTKPRIKLNVDGSQTPIKNAPAVAEATTARPMAGGGAASVNSNPYPVLTGEEAARGGSSAFPQVKLSKIGADVPAPEQAVRVQIANAILGEDNNAVRTGVRTGNENTMRAEAVQAKHADQTPEQAGLRQQFVREQDALSQYAQKRVEATGANPNLTNPEQRGQVLNSAFHGEGSLSDYFKQAKQQIYDQAVRTTGDNPAPFTHLDSLFSDPQFLAEAERNGHTGVVSGAQKLVNLARDVGFKNNVGEISKPGSVQALQEVRKSNNAGWSHDNAATIAKINQAIDLDTAAAGGSDMYALGNKIHQAEKTLASSPGINKIFGAEDANGVKAGAPLEQIPGKLNNLPMDQWRHIHSTLDELSRGQIRGAPDGMPPVPEALQQIAAKAKSEMAGQLAREVYEKGAEKAGVWNHNSVNKALNSVVGQKILESFPPDEVQAFHTLNYGGQIMPGMHSYEGAGLQTARVNAGPGFIEKYAPNAAMVAGAHIAGPIAGPVVGRKVGNIITNKLMGSRLTGDGNKLIEAMRANADFGK